MADKEKLVFMVLHGPEAGAEALHLPLATERKVFGILAVVCLGQENLLRLKQKLMILLRRLRPPHRLPQPKRAGTAVSCTAILSTPTAS